MCVYKCLFRHLVCVWVGLTANTNQRGINLIWAYKLYKNIYVWTHYIFIDSLYSKTSLSGHLLIANTCLRQKFAWSPKHISIDAWNPLKDTSLFRIPDTNHGPNNICYIRYKNHSILQMV